MDYDELVSKSLYGDELTEIVAGLQAVQTLPAGVNGELIYLNRQGEALAKYWLNTDIGEWVVLIDIHRAD